MQNKENYVRKALQDLAKGDLKNQNFKMAIDEIFKGEADDLSAAGLLASLSIKGESDDQLFEALEVINSQMIKVRSVDALDIVGTGGDHKNSHNISVASALTASACGLNITKHGNRSVSSACGSADVLEELKINIEHTSKSAVKSLDNHNFVFLFARLFHPAMRHVAHVRASLGIRTIFNLLGPIANPASPEYLLVGVYDSKWQMPLAKVLKRSGAKSAWIVTSKSGFDELISLEENKVTAFSPEKEISEFTIDPKKLGLGKGSFADLVGADPKTNAKAIRDFADLKINNALSETIILNVAVALKIAGKVTGLEDGIATVKKALDGGLVAKKLKEIINAD